MSSLGAVDNGVWTGLVECNTFWGIGGWGDQMLCRSGENMLGGKGVSHFHGHSVKHLDIFHSCMYMSN